MRGKRRAQPDEDEQEECHFDAEPDERRAAHAAERAKRPPAQEERRQHRTGGNHVDVFGHLEEAPAQPAELRQIARDQFLFRLWQIERRAVHLRNRRNAKQDEAERLRQNEPDALMHLRMDDIHHVERAREHQHAHQREADADLIRHHLRRRAQRAEQRIVVAR